MHQEKIPGDQIKAATNSQKVRMILKRAMMMMINMLASLQDAQNRNYRLPTDWP